MSWRIRSVRKRILLLVLVPVLSLFGLYVFTTSITGREALNLARARALKAATSQPVGNFLGQLDTERVFALTYLSAPSHGNLAKLQATEARTNRVTADLRAALTAGSVTKNASAGERQAIATLLNAASRLPALHSSINARSTSRSQALAAYGTLIGDSYLLFNQVIMAEDSAQIVAQALALERMSKSAELLQQENVLLVADMAGRTFPPADQQAFTQLVGARRTLFGQTLSELDPAYRAIWQQAASPGAYQALTSLENAVVGNAHPGALPVRPIPWQRAVRRVSLGFERAAVQASDALGQRAEQDARATDLRLLLSGGLGLLAVVASVVVSLLIGRGLVRELRTLRLSALELANDRLPKVVDQLSAGMDVEVPSEPAGPPAKSSEIGQVREAFAKVQQMAVQAAVGQARLREGISEVFRNLARRSQSLLHRQLALLDGMERRAKDPQELEDLFRIDHLTTRMRRHAESLIILSGRAPARGWRNPVPLVDVLRAAVAEVEDYTRVRVISAADAALAGPAVGDVIHMIAEFVENATIFSPPNTPVVISGDIVGQGFAVEIEDRGLGLSEQRLAEVNDRLEHPPPFDPASTDQLGLFVAGQLAQRHGIRITLRPNPYGGITAIILIPHSVVVAEGITGPEPARALESATQAPGRHATRGENGAGDGEESAGSPDRAPALGPAGDWPGPETRLTEFPQPHMTDAWLQASVPPGPDAAETGDADAAGLPRRVRQASLAPQLRDGGMPLSAPPPSEPYPRSPEDARSTMTAMQQGWERGRSLFEPAKPATAPDSQFAASAEPGYGPGREAASGQAPGPDLGPAPPPPPGPDLGPPPPPPSTDFGTAPGTDLGTVQGADFGTGPGSDYGPPPGTDFGAAGGGGRPPADFGGPGDRVTGPADMDGTTDAAADQHDAETEGRSPGGWS